jgi:hypothetical protein
MADMRLRFTDLQAANEGLRRENRQLRTTLQASGQRLTEL